MRYLIDKIPRLLGRIGGQHHHGHRTRLRFVGELLSLLCKKGHIVLVRDEDGPQHQRSGRDYSDPLSMKRFEEMQEERSRIASVVVRSVSEIVSASVRWILEWEEAEVEVGVEAETDSETESETKQRRRKELEKIKRVVVGFIFVILGRLYAFDVDREKSEEEEEEEGEGDVHPSFGRPQHPFSVRNCTVLAKRMVRHLASLRVSMNSLLTYVGKEEKWAKMKRDREAAEFDSGDFARALAEDKDDEEEDEDEEKEEFVRWDCKGIGAALVEVFVNRTAADSFTHLLYTRLHLFVLSMPYIRGCVMSGWRGIATRVGLRLFSHFLRVIPDSAIIIPKRLQEETLKDKKSMFETHFNMLQGMINFMASCPDDKVRSQTLEFVNQYISKFSDYGRFEILSGTIKKCPYPSFLGLFVSRLKEEFRLEYNSRLKAIGGRECFASQYAPSTPPEAGASEDCSSAESCVPASPARPVAIAGPPIVRMTTSAVRLLKSNSRDSEFLSRKMIGLLIEVMLRYCSDITVDSIDASLHVMNLYYFILLRDAHPNVTEIVSGELIEKIQTSVLDKLEARAQQVLENLDRTPESFQLEEEEGEFDFSQISDRELEEDCGLSKEEIELIREDEAEKKEKGLLSFGELKSVCSIPEENRRFLQVRLFLTVDLIDRIRKVFEGVEGAAAEEDV